MRAGLLSEEGTRRRRRYDLMEDVVRSAGAKYQPSFYQESYEYENFYSCVAEHEAQYRAQGKRLPKYLFKVGESTCWND